MTEATPQRRRRADGERTWRRVIEAAVETILERGYYGASSNEIARRAGVTWGTIQHQFGTREGLLLAVLNDRWQRLHDRVNTATIEGDTLEARLSSLLDVLATHYGEPENLAQMQIALDLVSNPDTSEPTRAAAKHHGELLRKAWDPLFAQALGPASDHADLVNYAFLVLRGFLTANLIANRISTLQGEPTSRRLLVQGVASTIRFEAAERGVALE